MTLEKPNEIDMICRRKGGGIDLIITDSGVTYHAEQRVNFFLQKLESYGQYIVGPNFANQYPRHSLEELRILVMHTTAPTVAMKEASLVLGNKERTKIQIVFHKFVV